MFSPKIKRCWEKCCIWIKIKIGLYCVTRGVLHDKPFSDDLGRA